MGQRQTRAGDRERDGAHPDEQERIVGRRPEPKEQIDEHSHGHQVDCTRVRVAA